MTSSSIEHKRTGCPQPKTVRASTHLEIRTDSETLLDVIDANSFDTRSRDTVRPLSLRITDLVNEAFPMPVSIDDISGQLSTGGSEGMNEATTRTNSPPPPGYIPLQQPPRYNRSGSLADQLPDSFSVPMKYDRISLISSIPIHPYNTYYDLMLLSPGIPFDGFVQMIQDKATAYILSERKAKRLLPDEAVVCVPEIKVRTAKRGLFKSAKVARSTIKEEFWPAVLSISRESPGDVKLKVRFWTKRTSRKESSATSGDNVNLLEVVVPVML